MKNWKKECRKSFAIETGKSKLWNWARKPSTLCAAFFLGFALLTLPLSPPNPEKEVLAHLKQHHWVLIESAPCERLRERQYFELDFGKRTREVYKSGDGSIYASGPLPDSDFISCRKIKGPSFVEEL